MIHTKIWNEMERMRREMEDMFYNPQYTLTRNSFPLVNSYENQEELILVVELPGINKGDLNLTLENGYLKLSGKRLPPTMKDDVAMLRQEIPEGDFSKTFKLPQKIDEEMINAKLENGVLTLRVPKPEEAKPKKIQINS